MSVERNQNDAASASVVPIPLGDWSFNCKFSTDAAGFLKLGQGEPGGVAHGLVGALVVGNPLEEGRGAAVAGGGDEIDQLELYQRIGFTRQGGEHAGAHEVAFRVRIKSFEGAQPDVGVGIQIERLNQV